VGVMVTAPEAARQQQASSAFARPGWNTVHCQNQNTPMSPSAIRIFHLQSRSNV